MAKKVILCVIDSLHPQALEQCFRRGRLPVLRFLRDNGYYHKDCVSIFPTMTPTAAAAITTGQYPDVHGVPAFVWYDHGQQRIVNYGATPMAVRKIGVKTVLEELLYNLNDRHLNAQVPTIYELLSQNGISTACINFFVHRGERDYQGRLPFTFRLASCFRLSSKPIKGPGELVLGKVVCPDWLDPKRAPAAPWNKFGVNDIFTGYALKEMIKQDRLPEFTLAYFPDTDGMAHEYGPLAVEKSLKRVDGLLGAVLNLYGSWEAALQEVAVIVVGDHAQTLIGKSRRHLIDLQEELNDFTQLGLDQLCTDECIVISPNERMAIISFPQRDAVTREKVIKRLSRDYRITQLMWKEGEEYRVMQGGTQRRLSFKEGGQYWDRYNKNWSWYGDMKVLDLRVQDRQLVDAEYPDAFNRVKSALDCDPHGIYLSAMPGYEFKGEHAPLHPGGGSHGSLHREDSVVPLLLAGMDKDLPNPRITSFIPYLSEHFGITNSIKT